VVPGGGPPDPGSPQGRRKRDPVPFIVAGVLAAVLVAVFCLGGALILFERRTTPPPPSQSPSPPLPATTGEPMPSPGPSGSEGGGNPLSRAAAYRWSVSE